MTTVKIKDRDGLYRDLSSGAIINTNTVEYNNFLKRKVVSDSIKQQIEKNSQEITEVKKELTEIKELLISLIRKEN